MNTNWQLFADYWPFLVPLIILEFGLMITAVIHILRHQHYRFGNRLLWLLLVIFIQIIGTLSLDGRMKIEHPNFATCQQAFW